MIERENSTKKRQRRAWAGWGALAALTAAGTAEAAALNSQVFSGITSETFFQFVTYGTADAANSSMSVEMQSGCNGTGSSLPKQGINPVSSGSLAVDANQVPVHGVYDNGINFGTGYLMLNVACAVPGATSGTTNANTFSIPIFYNVYMSGCGWSSTYDNCSSTGTVHYQWLQLNSFTANNVTFPASCATASNATAVTTNSYSTTNNQEQLTVYQPSFVLDNPFALTSSSTTVTVTDTAHGYKTGDTVTFSGATDIGGTGTNVTASVLNQAFQITVIDSNTYSITLSVTPNSTAIAGSPGGGAAVTASPGWGVAQTPAIAVDIQQLFNGFTAVSAAGSYQPGNQTWSPALGQSSPFLVKVVCSSLSNLQSN